MPFDDVYGPPEVPRDRYGRPLIKHPDGRKSTAYTRCTTYVGCLEDTFNLAKWQQRMVALGLAARPDLLLATSAHSDDKQRLNGICDEAREAAAASAAATTGTALHRLAERLDRGDGAEIPAAAEADLDAYMKATAAVDWLHIEHLTVNDDLKVAGTPDRVGGPKGGPARIYDLKTGASLDFGVGKMAMQLAMYARSRLYDATTGERTDLDVDLMTGVIIHLPAGTGVCTMYEIDIAAGWEAVQLATQVRAWRSRKDLLRPVAAEPAVDVLASLIAIVANPDELIALWHQYRADWTPAHSAMAAARKSALTAAAA